MTKFDDAITALKAEHFDEPATLQLIDIVVAQNERLKNAEHFTLEAKSRLGAVEKIQNDHTQSIASLASTRDENAKRIVAVENAPVDQSKKIKELDERVTTVEGAVGSKAYRRAEAKVELTPPVTDEPIVPVTDEPKPGWKVPNLVGGTPAQ